MCRSMVDIHSPTAEIRRGKKERRNHRMEIYCPHLLGRAAIKLRWNRCVFKNRLKVRSEGADDSECGRAFHFQARAVATGNARSPSVEQPVAGN